MRHLRIGLLCVLSAFPVSGAIAQEVFINRTTTEMPPQFPGMGPRQFKTGTARIRGRVMSAETGAPVRRAQVRISGPDIGSKIGDDGRGRPVRVPGSARRQIQSVRRQVRVRHRAVRADAAVRVRKADRARRRADLRQGGDRDAARQRDLGPRARRVRRAGRRRDGERDALGVDGRTTEAARRPGARRRPTISVSTAFTACLPATITSAPRCAPATR